MRISFRNQDYYLDENQLTEKMFDKVDNFLDKKIEIKNGPTIDFRKKSLTMVAMRQVFVAFLPFISYAASILKVELPKKEKHADIIQYVLKCYILLLNKSLSIAHISVEDETYVDDMRIISNYSIEVEKPVPLLGELSGQHNIP